MKSFLARSQKREKRLSASSCLAAVCPQEKTRLWTDFFEILYVGVFRKSVETIEVRSKPDKNFWYFT
jgi:hypothetical protein